MIEGTDGAQSAALFLQIGVIVIVVAGGPGDTVQTTVIDIDPLPAVIHRAHVLPEETEGDKDPFRPAVYPRRLHGIGARDDILLYRGQDPGRRRAEVDGTDGGQMITETGGAAMIAAGGAAEA